MLVLVEDAAEPFTSAYAEASEYVKRLDGYSSDLYRKTSPEGRAWQFGYDTFGNLKSVTDPKGVSTPAEGHTKQRRCADTHGEHPMTRTDEDRMDTERGTDE